MSEFANGAIRKLWASENDKLADHLLRLDKESRLLRFGHQVSDEFIRDYGARVTDMRCVIFAYVEAGEVRAVAEMRKLGDDWGDEAEAAFSVEAEWQEHGIGTELMGRIIRTARNRRIRRLHMACLMENRRMQKIARNHHADLHIEYGNVLGKIVPDGPSIASLAGEAADDTRGFVMAVLDLQMQMLKSA